MKMLCFLHLILKDWLYSVGWNSSLLNKKWVPFEQHQFPLLPLFLHLWLPWHFLSKPVSQAGDCRLSDVILHTDVRCQPQAWLGGKMTSLALTVMAPCCKKLAILILLFSFYCLFRCLGSTHSCLAVLLKLWHSPSKALTLPAASNRRTMTNNLKPGPSPESFWARSLYEACQRETYLKLSSG